MRYLGPGEKVLFMQKSFWRPSEARYLIKEIKSYEKVCTCKRGSKDLVFNGKGWKDFDENRLTFWVIRNVSPFAARNIWLWGNQNFAGKILGWELLLLLLYQTRLSWEYSNWLMDRIMDRETDMVSMWERFFGDGKDKQEDGNYEFKRRERDSGVIDVDRTNNQLKKRKLKKIWFFFFSFLLWTCLFRKLVRKFFALELFRTFNFIVLFKVYVLFKFWFCA